jgi:thioredoxin reductase (NADPH)
MAQPTNANNEDLFPKLSEAHIARLASMATRRSVKAGELIYNQGEHGKGLFVLLSGRVDAVSQTGEGEVRIRVLEPGEFTGEIATLTGHATLASTRALEPSEVLEIDVQTLRRVVQTDPELSEILLSTFVRRRAALIARQMGGLVLIGSQFSPDSLRLREFLARNGHPFTYLDVERDAAVAALLEHFGFSAADIPVLVCRGLKAMRNPSNALVARCLGFDSEVDENRVYDLIVIGAGPAGLAAAVYAASEGLEVLVLESKAPGGQAGSSSRIENYLGFPTGISGQELAGRAFVQAEKFGAHVAITRVASGLKCDRRPFRVECEGAGPVAAKALIIASGAEYRRLPLANLSRFEGVGIYYGATPMEAQLCAKQEAVVVGGGNSAGQAAVFLSTIAKHVHVLVRGRGLAEFLATIARHVHLLVRGAGLADSMSRYLIRRIEDCAEITLRTRTEVTAVDGNGHLERMTWNDRERGATETREIRHLFSMTGARPNTRWLNGCVAVDEKEFIKTGADLTQDDLSAAQWPLRRQPYLFETSVPRIFAVGDVRASSAKRVASAVGEGSVAVQLVHRVLAE